MSMLSENTTNFFVQAVKKLELILYPHQCPGCDILLDSRVEWCSDCRISLAHTMSLRYCLRCGQTLGPHQRMKKGRCPRCEKVSLPLIGVCRVGVYSQALANTIINFKYRRDMYGITTLAKMLADRLIEQDWFDEIELLCPIPAHWTRRVHRGFNQSAVIAEELGRIVDKPVIPLLKRIKPTLQQTGMSAAKRAMNIKGAFAINGKWNLTSSNICLIDDVMTTGATLNEAARTLKRAGANNIFAAVLARAENIDVSI